MPQKSSGVLSEQTFGTPNKKIPGSDPGFQRSPALERVEGISFGKLILLN